jgi:hypothetical protein
MGAFSTPSISPISGARRHRAAELAAEDSGHLLHLLVRRGLVDEHAEPPVALGHDLGRVGDHGELDAADIGAFHLAFLDVEDESHPAVVVGRAVVERHVAGAHQLAGAGLEIAPLDAPRHANLLVGAAKSRF